MLRRVGFAGRAAFATLSATGALAPLAGCSSGSDSAPPAAASGDWRPLLEDESFAGWNRVGDASWRFDDGAVMADSGTGFLVTDRSYADFDLEVEFFVSPDANSGVFLRCAEPANPGAANCYEVNIFDQRPDPSYRTGAIVDVAQPAVTIDTGNRWNRYEIGAHGRRLTVKLNGETTVDTEDDKLAAGPIGLQYGAGVVQFRNVRIRER